MNEPVADKDPTAQGIEAVAFKPLISPAKRRRQWLTAASAIVGGLLLACLVALWFLLTSRALILVTDPVSAEVDISGGLSFRIGESYLLRPGHYQLQVNAEGYYPHRQPLEITAADSQQLHITLDKKPGKLAVTTVPEGVTVILDNQSLGTSPGLFPDIEPGTHQLVLSHPRYRPWQQPLDIEGLDNTTAITATLEPAWGEIAISSEPAGATILVGETEAGTTPATIEVLEQGESVSVQLPGYKTWRRDLQATAGTTQTLPPIVLEPADATVTLTSRPAGARIMVDSLYRGQTPATLDITPGARHQLTVLQPGYQSQQIELQLASGEQKQLAIDLKPNLGTLRVQLQPANATLYVDGQPVRDFNGVLSLPARSHNLEARLPGYITARKTVVPKPGLEQRVDLTLVTEAEAQRQKLPATLSANGQTLRLFNPQGSRFTLGSSRREQGRRANEMQKPVILQRAFYMATTPVTNAQFKKFRPLHSSSHASGKTLDLPDQPVVRITWQDAALYCNWLSQQQGFTPVYTPSGDRVNDPGANGYRLPTEAEWAWAARYRQGTMARFPWGENFPPPANSGNYADSTSAAITGRALPGYSDGAVVSAPVTAFAANDKGLYSLGHNVAEWVHDFYGIEPALTGATAATDPLGPDQGEFHVIRGASWRHGTITELRLSFRDYGKEARDDVGFRVVRYAQ